ncbi:DUF6159 family protein [Halorubellus litoreus]|uniref:DUF6159 family protein n=1 Tax=Halorubellus litoreus TaxID=755308 RepID=A0ABD5VEQ4_9EURY
MGFFNRLKTGWALTKDSIRVLRGDPELAVFPLVGSIAGLLYVALLLVPGFFLASSDIGVLQYALLFVLYFGSTFIASFTTAALMHETRKAFRGEEPSFKSGISAAWEHKRTLLAWSAISATVGVIIQLIDSQDNFLAEVLASIISVGWSILTYFVIPVITFEDVGVRGAIARSGETFKNTWGETAGATFGVGIVTILFMLPVAIVAAGIVVLGGLSGGALGFGGALLVAASLIFVAYIFTATLGSIARLALYVYATDGERPSAFEDVDLGTVPE